MNYFTIRRLSLLLVLLGIYCPSLVFAQNSTADDNVWSYNITAVAPTPQTAAQQNTNIADAVVNSLGSMDGNIQMLQANFAATVSGSSDTDIKPWTSQMLTLFQRAGVPRIWTSLRPILVLLATLLLTLTILNMLRNGRLDHIDLLFRFGMFAIVWGGANQIYYYGFFIQQGLPGAMMQMAEGSPQNWESAVRTQRLFAEARKAVIRDVVIWINSASNHTLTKIDNRPSPAADPNNTTPAAPTDASLRGGPTRMDSLELADVILDLIYSGTTVGPSTICNGDSTSDLVIPGLQNAADVAGQTAPITWIAAMSNPVAGTSTSPYDGMPPIPPVAPTVTYANVTLKNLEAINYGINASAQKASVDPKTYIPPWVMSYGYYAMENTGRNSMPSLLANAPLVPSKLQQVALALNAQLAYLSACDVITTYASNTDNSTVDANTPNSHEVYNLKGHSSLAKLYADRLSDLNGLTVAKEDDDFYPEVYTAYFDAMASMGIIPQGITLISSADTKFKDKLTVKLGTYIPQTDDKGKPVIPGTPVLAGNDNHFATNASDLTRLLTPNGPTTAVNEGVDTKAGDWLLRQFTKILTVLNHAVNKGILYLYVFLYSLLFQIQFFVMMLTTPFIFSDKLDVAFKGQAKALLYIVLVPAVAGLVLGMWTTFMGALISGSLSTVIGVGTTVAATAGAIAIAGLMGSMAYGTILAFILMNIFGSIIIAAKIRGWTEKVISGASIAGDVLKSGATAIAGGAIGGFALSSALIKGAGASAGGLGQSGSFASNFASAAQKGNGIIDTAKGIANDPTSTLARGRSTIPNMSGNEKPAANERTAVGTAASNDDKLKQSMSALPFEKQRVVEQELAGLRSSPAYQNLDENQKRHAVTNMLEHAGVRDHALAAQIAQSDHKDTKHNDTVATNETREANSHQFNASAALRHSTAAKAAVAAKKTDPKERQEEIEQALTNQGMSQPQAKALSKQYLNHKETDPLRQSTLSKLSDYRRANLAHGTGFMSDEQYKDNAGVKAVHGVAERAGRSVAQTLRDTQILHRKTEVNGTTTFEMRAGVKTAVKYASTAVDFTRDRVDHARHLLGPVAPNITHMNALVQSVAMSVGATQSGFSNIQQLITQQNAKTK